jgi:hypothetical protein
MTIASTRKTSAIHTTLAEMLSLIAKPPVAAPTDWPR